MFLGVFIFRRTFYVLCSVSSEAVLVSRSARRVHVFLDEIVEDRPTLEKTIGFLEA
jgi:hypothetical protein